jgi:hypothetical protein
VIGVAGPVGRAAHGVVQLVLPDHVETRLQTLDQLAALFGERDRDDGAGFLRHGVPFFAAVRTSPRDGAHNFSKGNANSTS